MRQTAASGSSKATDSFDINSDAWLRTAIRETQEDGWDSMTGRRLLHALRERCRIWAPAVDRHCGQDVPTTDAAELLSTAWLVLDRSADKVVDAEHSWAYLWRAVRNDAAVQCTSTAVVSESIVRRSPSDARTMATPVRVGNAGWILDRTVTTVYGSAEAAPTSGWSPALQGLLQLIVHRGGDQDFWADAIDQAVNTLASSRRSYEEHSLRRDPYLRGILGLSPDQLSALSALLIGTRRGDRARQSLLLALHRNPAAVEAEVPGADRRMTTLLEVDLARRGRAGTPSMSAA